MKVLKIEVEGTVSYLPISFILTEMKISHDSVTFPLNKTDVHTKKLGGGDKNWIERSIERGDIVSVYSKFGIKSIPS